MPNQKITKMRHRVNNNVNNNNNNNNNDNEQNNKLLPHHASYYPSLLRSDDNSKQQRPIEWKGPIIYQLGLCLSSSLKRAIERGVVTHIRRETKRPIHHLLIVLSLLAMTSAVVSLSVKTLWRLAFRHTGYISDLKRLGYVAKPRLFRYVIFYDDDDDGTIVAIEARRMNVHSLRIPPPPPSSSANETAILEERKRSRFYRRGRAEPFVTDTCIQQYDWQIRSYPNCNNIHEIYGLDDLGSGDVRILTNGYWRDVWSVRSPSVVDGRGQTTTILKTLRYTHEIDGRNYDRHRKDALAMARLTSSPYVIDIYAYCGNSGLSEFGRGGDIQEVLWPRKGGGSSLTKLDRLRIATQVAQSIAAMHDIDKVGRASIAHTDISLGQFILIDGFYKLNDFNRARFMRQDRRTGASCGYRVGNNPGRFRSPEEYKYDIQDEKVDVYSMGNIIYAILTNRFPFEDIKKEKTIKQMVMDGERPRVDESIRRSRDPVDVALLRAMTMCHVHDPKERASAREVFDYLNNKFEEVVKLKIYESSNETAHRHRDG